MSAVVVTLVVCLTVLALAEMARRTVWRMRDAPPDPERGATIERLEAKVADLDRRIRSHDAALAKRVRA
jgi:hypothetical protein